MDNLPYDVVFQIIDYLPEQIQLELIEDTPVGKYVCDKLYSTIYLNYSSVDYEVRPYLTPFKPTFNHGEELEQFLLKHPYFEPNVLEIHLKFLNRIRYAIYHILEQFKHIRVKNFYQGPIISTYTLTLDNEWSGKYMEEVEYDARILTHDVISFDLSEELKSLKMDKLYDSVEPIANSILKLHQLKFLSMGILIDISCMKSLEELYIKDYFKPKFLPRQLRSITCMSPDFLLLKRFDKIGEFFNLNNLCLDISDNIDNPTEALQEIFDKPYPKSLQHLKITLMAYEQPIEIYNIDILQLKSLSLRFGSRIHFNNTQFPKSLTSLTIEVLYSPFDTQELMEFPPDLLELKIINIGVPEDTKFPLSLTRLHIESKINHLNIGHLIRLQDLTMIYVRNYDMLPPNVSNVSIRSCNTPILCHSDVKVLLAPMTRSLFLSPNLSVLSLLYYSGDLSIMKSLKSLRALSLFDKRGWFSESDPLSFDFPPNLRYASLSGFKGTADQLPKSLMTLRLERSQLDQFPKVIGLEKIQFLDVKLRDPISCLLPNLISLSIIADVIITDGDLSHMESLKYLELRGRTTNTVTKLPQKLILNRGEYFKSSSSIHE